MVDNRNPLCGKFLSYYQEHGNQISPSCRGFFCAGRSLTDPISALPLLFSLSMSVMLSRTLNIFIASLSQNSRICSNISQDTLFTFFHRIMTSWLAGSLTHRSCSQNLLVPHIHYCSLNVISYIWFQPNRILFLILFLQFVEIILNSIPALQNTCRHIQHLKKLFCYPGH